MIEVIEHGFKKFKGECFICNCKFTYELEDIDKNAGKVICPDCGHEVSHYPDDKVRGSQIE